MNYLEQLEKAIVFIEDKLCDDIKVDEVASIAGYSYYHFHRVFEAVVGETAGNYLRSRRLSRAAHDLIYTDKKILDIAILYQFESQEAFNRAFKKVYQQTPGYYRNNRIDVIMGEKKQLSSIRLKHLYDAVTVRPQIIERDPVMIVGIRDKTTIRTNKIPEMWKSFNPRINEIRNRTIPFRGYGICEVDPLYAMTEFNEDSEYNEIVGVEVNQPEDIPEGMVAKLLRGGKYAVFTHKGKINNLMMTYDYIWGTWIPYSGYELDLRDDFECYDDRFLGPDDDRSQFDIFIPIK